MSVTRHAHVELSQLLLDCTQIRAGANAKHLVVPAFRAHHYLPSAVYCCSKKERLASAGRAHEIGRTISPPCTL